MSEKIARTGDMSRFGDTTRQLVVAGVCGLGLARRPDRWGSVGDLFVLILVLGMLVASIGEPWVPSQADSPGFLLVLFHIALYVVGVAVAVAAVRDLRARRRALDQPEGSVTA